MSLKERMNIFWMKFGLKMLNSQRVMGFAEKNFEKKKQKQLKKNDKLKKQAKARRLVTKDEITATNHAIRGLRYDVKELAKKVDELQKQISK